MQNILITGFEPFGDWDTNPSSVAAIRLNGKTHMGYTIIGKEVKLEYHSIKKEISELIYEYSPKAVILTGQRSGGTIYLEKMSYNKVDARIPYNCGTKPEGEIIDESGPSTIQSTLPLDIYYQVLDEEAIPVEFSEDPGRFGCNQIFYQVRNDFDDLPAGFVHVPLLPSQAEEDEWLKQEIINDAIELIVKSTIEWIKKEK